VFGPHDELPVAPRRVLVAGITGAGKSTLAVRVAAILDVPYTEIDGLYHGPNWTPRASFLTDVDALAAGEGWVTEWQYSSARDRLAARADTILWLDLPLRVSLRRLVVRSVRRRIRRTPLWAGNVEAPWWHLFTGQDHVRNVPPCAAHPRWPAGPASGRSAAQPAPGGCLVRPSGER
jgi:adenylate kinase family enzyme